MATFGKNYDGTISRCRAKPENRGKGNCYHSKHMDLNLSPQQVHAHNEKILRKKLGLLGQRMGKNSIPDFANDEIRTHPSNAPLSRDNFNSATMRIAQSFPEEDWEVISTFYQKIASEVNRQEIAKNFDNSVLSISRFLESDDRTAKKVREFLGPEVDSTTFAKILTSEVGSMTRAIQFRNTGHSMQIKRIFLTNFNNDMNKERYVASVLFFGGRCCYCNGVLTRETRGNRRDSTATGEHITPLASAPGGIMGGTRFGNMALACHGCNHERGTKDLKTWVRDTSRITPANKEASLQRIAAFRRFALYSEYTLEESNKIRESVGKLHKFYSTKTRGEDKKFSPRDEAEIKDYIKISLYDLKQELREL